MVKIVRICALKQNVGFCTLAKPGWSVVTSAHTAIISVNINFGRY